jgi:hypothetical protein
VLGDDGGRLGFDEFDLLLECPDHGLDCSREKLLGRLFEAIELHGAQGNKLAAAGLEPGKTLLPGRRRRTVHRLDGQAEASQDLGIDSIGFGQDAGGPGEVPDLAWVDADGGQPGLNEAVKRSGLVTAGGLEQDAGRRMPGEPADQVTASGRSIGKTLDGTVRVQCDVEEGFGDVDAGDGVRSGADAGCAEGGHVEPFLAMRACGGGPRRGSSDCSGEHEDKAGRDQAL